MFNILAAAYSSWAFTIQVDRFTCVRLYARNAIKLSILWRLIGASD